VERVAKAVHTLVEEGYMLPADADYFIKQAGSKGVGP
jgi:hypothetical protein